jgi:hypothetical protein
MITKNYNLQLSFVKYYLRSVSDFAFVIPHDLILQVVSSASLCQAFPKA